MTTTTIKRMLVLACLAALVALAANLLHKHRPRRLHRSHGNERDEGWHTCERALRLCARDEKKDFGQQ